VAAVAAKISLSFWEMWEKDGGLGPLAVGLLPSGKRSRARLCTNYAWSQSKWDFAGSKHRYGHAGPPCLSPLQQPGEFLAGKSLPRQSGCCSTFL